MYFTAHRLDHKGMIVCRLEHYKAHKAYLATSPVKTIMSDPLLAEMGRP